MMSVNLIYTFVQIF